MPPLSFPPIPATGRCAGSFHHHVALGSEVLPRSQAPCCEAPYLPGDSVLWGHWTLTSGLGDCALLSELILSPASPFFKPFPPDLFQILMYIWASNQMLSRLIWPVPPWLYLTLRHPHSKLAGFLLMTLFIPSPPTPQEHATVSLSHYVGAQEAQN